MTKRVLYIDDDKFFKFWSISLEGTTQIVTSGRIGTKGRSRTKEFSSKEEAKQSCEKLLAKKFREGFVEAHYKGAKKASEKKVAKKLPPKKAPSGRKQGMIRCIYVTTKGDKTMDRGWYWDPTINRLPCMCQTCGFIDLDALPRDYRLIRKMTVSNAEIAIVGRGNFVVRERVRDILKCVAPKTCGFRSTYYQDVREKTPWTLVVPKHQLETARVKKAIKRCPNCKQPEKVNDFGDYDEWLHIDPTDPSFGKTNKARKGMKGAVHPRERYAACRESTHEIFKSSQWNGRVVKDEWQGVDRDLFLSIRLWELLKRVKVKGPVWVAYKERDIEPFSEEMEWVEEKLELLQRRDIPLTPVSGGSTKDNQWLQTYMKEHARKKRTTPDFAKFEKKHGLKLPKSFKDFLTKVGRKTFHNIDGEEGFSAHILGLTKVDCKEFRRGEVRVSDDASKEVDGIMFASTDHGDCFCLDVKAGQKEFAVVLLNHDYEIFEQYAPSFASCIRRFEGS